MEEDISLDIKEWMPKVKKPRSMSVQALVQRLNHLNDLIKYTPMTDPTNNPGKQTPKFNSCPTAVLQGGKGPNSSKAMSFKSCCTNQILHWVEEG
jgi:hypothetical protein